MSFNDETQLIKNLSGFEILYNTYWVRFNHTLFNHQEAVSNTKISFQAAQKAGIKKLVHLNITNPDANSHLEYFQGKGELEDALKQTGLDYTILRPTVIFGPETFSYNSLTEIISHSMRRNVQFIHLPKIIVYFLSKIIGWWYEDEVLTLLELNGLMAD